MQIDPGPIPTFKISAPALYNFLAASPVAILPTQIGVLLFIFAKPISAFFVPNEIELVLEAAFFIRIMALTFGFIGMQMVIFGTLKAAGKTTTAMFLALFNTIMVFVISYVLSSIVGMQQLGIWVAYPISNVISAGIAYYFYWRKDWLKKELV